MRLAAGRFGRGKLNFLLSQQPSPPETFVNLLLLYCKYSYYDLAADILAENAELRPGFLLSRGLLGASFHPFKGPK